MKANKSIKTLAEFKDKHSFSAESLLPTKSVAGLCGFQRRKDKSILLYFHVTQVTAESCHPSKPLHRDSAEKRSKIENIQYKCATQLKLR